MEPLKDGYNMAWLERLKRSWKRPREEKHGNLYLELCPDNRINSFMVVRHRPQGTDPFMEFIGHAADKAIREGNGTVPDNLLLALAGMAILAGPAVVSLLTKEKKLRNVASKHRVPH